MLGFFATIILNANILNNLKTYHFNISSCILIFFFLYFCTYYSCIEKERTKYNILIASNKQPDIKM